MLSTCFEREVCKTICVAFESCDNRVLGNLLAKQLASDGANHLESMIEDNEGNLIIAGNFSGTVDFGGEVKTSFGFQDVFVAKYESSTGDLIWVNSGWRISG